MTGTQKANELNTAIIKTKDILGFSADYLMHNLYELNFEEQRQVLYSLCGNLYLAEHDLHLIVNHKAKLDKIRNYQPESFRSIQYLTLDIKKIVSEFSEKQKDNQEFLHYRNILTSLSA